MKPKLIVSATIYLMCSCFCLSEFCNSSQYRFITLHFTRFTWSVSHFTSHVHASHALQDKKFDSLKNISTARDTRWRKFIRLEHVVSDEFTFTKYLHGSHEYSILWNISSHSCRTILETLLVTHIERQTFRESKLRWHSSNRSLGRATMCRATHQLAL